MDVLKPFPARSLESLPGGAGVVLDDVMAGVYSWIILWLTLPLLETGSAWFAGWMA